MDTKDIELHSLFEGRLNLYQYTNGYRFSIDTPLLASFARESVCAEPWQTWEQAAACCRYCWRAHLKSAR